MNRERLRVAGLRMEPMEAIVIGELELTDSSPQTSPGIHEEDWCSTSKPMGDKQQQLQEKCEVLLIPIVTTSLIEQKT